MLPGLIFFPRSIVFVHALRWVANGICSTAEVQDTVLEEIVQYLQPSTRIRSWVYDDNESLDIHSGPTENIDIQARRLYTAVAKNDPKVFSLLSIEKI